MDFFINYNPNQSETIYFPEFFFTLTSYTLWIKIIYLNASGFLTFDEARSTKSDKRQRSTFIFIITYRETVEY